MIEINKSNVSELWELYEEYKKNFYKRYYSSVECEDFQTFVENNVKQCSNCEAYVLEENMGISELALQDNICLECIEEGYGR